MRLQDLRITNFRNIVQAQLAIEENKLVVIRAGNRQGKSSIRQAISMLLTPSTDGLDPLGRGYATKIRRGASKAEIEGTIQGSVHQVRRRVMLGLSREDKTVCLDDPDWHPLPFEQLLEYNRAALSVCLNTDNFLLTLDEAKQKTLLSSLVLPSQYDFPADKVAEVERLLGKGAINFAGDPLAAIEKAYRKLYDERAAANKRVKEFAIPDSLPIPEGVDSKGLQQQLEEARHRRRTIQTERDAVVARVSSEASETAKLESRITTLDAKLREDDARIRALESKILDDNKLEGLKTVVSQKGKRDAIRAQRSQGANVITMIDDQLEKMRSLRDAGQSTCPTCDQPIDLVKINTIIDELTGNLNKYKRADSEFVREESLIGNVEAAETAVKAHEEAASDKKAIQSKIAETNKQLTKARKDFNGRQVLTVPPEYDERLKSVDDQIQKLETDLRPAIVAESRGEEIKKKTAELEVLKKSAADLDTMVKYFDKDGIKAELLGKHIGAFTHEVNAGLVAWGYKATFTIEPYEFNVTTSLGVTSPAKELSDSEKLLFSVALQCAVAKQSQIGLVVCDRMDTFLPSEREKVNACLYNMLVEGHLDQVWLIASDESQEVPEIPRSIFFTVENGQVVKQ